MRGPLRLVACLAGAATALSLAAPAAAQDTNTNPFPGIRRLRRVTPTQHINVLFVDLCAPGVSVRVTAASERARTVPSFGALVGAQAAVNGGFYNTRDLSMTDGYVVHAGARWGGTDHNYTGPVAFGTNRVEILPHEAVMAPDAWMLEAVEGHPTLVHDGVMRDNSGDTGLCPRNPRTAVGLTADRRTLILAVVDGRAPSRVGMTCNELAMLMAGFGARWALNLDGGGSSTMWLAGTGVVNFPSDGAPRTVSNHLAVYARGTGVAAHCLPPRFRAVYVNQTFPLARTTLDLMPGELFTGYIEMRNTGSATWTPARTRLATTQPRDRMSRVVGPGWISANRPAAIDRMVAPGAQGRFNFTVRAPAMPGEYSEYFGIVEEGVAWFSDPGEGGPPDNQLQIRVRTVTPPPDAGAVDAGGGADAMAADAAREAGAGDGALADAAMADGAGEDVAAGEDVGAGEDVAAGDAGEDVAAAADGAGGDGARAGRDAGDGGDGGAGAMPPGCGCAVPAGDEGADGARGVGALLAAVAAAIARRRRRRAR